MLKRLIKSELVARIGGWLVARYIRFVYDTSKVIRSPSDLDEQIARNAPMIFASWHGQFLMSPMIKPSGVPARMMVARHADAEIIARALQHFDVGLIRGAGAGKRKKDRGGASALREAVRSLEQGINIAMTADVPPGPARRAGLGIVTLARLSGRPIVPTGFATSRYKVLNTWSRFTINLPFSKLAMVMGERIFVAPDASPESLEETRQLVEARLNEVTRRAYKLADADPRRATPPTARSPEEPRTMLKTYRLLTRAARPAAGLLLRHRARKGKEVAERIGERLGFASRTRPSGPLWWFHAASVGETNAVLPLLHTLSARHPEIGILLTTFTVTSARIASARLPKGAIHQFVPLDSPAFVRRFLDYWRPDLTLFTESEIWPNLIVDTHARGIPLVLVNARMSHRSFQRWRRRPGMSKPLFSRFSLVLAQNDTLARRFQQLGAHEVITIGNLKVDAPPPPVNEVLLARLKKVIGDRPVFLAASTHPGEDEIVAEAHRDLRTGFPDLLTVIIPRHPERGPAIEDLLSRMQIRAARQSQNRMPTGETEIFIADTIGELGTWYALAPLAFVGGSLVRHGGQNPIEAVKLDTCVLVGPHRHNFAESYETLESLGGCRTINNATELAGAVGELYHDPQALAAMREGGAKTVELLGGALDRTLEALAPYLPGQADVEHAS